MVYARVALALFLTLIISFVLSACGGDSTQQRQDSTVTHPTTVPVTVSTDHVIKDAVADPYLWLEDVTSDRSLAWARALNAISTKELEAVPGFAAQRARMLSMLNSKDKIPFVEKYGDYLYNLWTDASNPRGLYRRTTLEEYRKATPTWETVLDIDALGKAENQSWVFEGMQFLYPQNERGLLSLSRGGADAVIVREFDLVKKTFVENGFTLPEAKTTVDWKDMNGHAARHSVQPKLFSKANQEMFPSAFHASGTTVKFVISHLVGFPFLPTRRFCAVLTVLSTVSTNPTTLKLVSGMIR
jgi:hypothetical protein